MNIPPDETLEGCRAAARQLAQQGARQAAEKSFLDLLARHPQDVEALRFVAECQCARAEHASAIGHLQTAAALGSDDPTVWVQLATAQMAAEDFAGAVVSFGRALALAPRMFVARLQSGIALERLGRPQEALKAYFMAIESARRQGRWQGDATTAPGLREAVRYAVNYVNSGRRHLFHAALDPLRQRYGSAELARVERSLAIYLLDQPANIPDPRQRPTFLYFPDIANKTYYPRQDFAWMETLEAATATVRDELRAVLAQERQLEAFLGEESPEQARGMLGSSSDQDPSWNAYFFHRHGRRHDGHCAGCPHTAALLDALPLVRIRDHAPEALFSVLSPGTHILAHTGVTNTRLVTHLPLIVPPDCAIRVAGQEHVWREGRGVTFDDTWEHEAWNRSDQLRVVLILDSWHPDLSEVERAAVTDLVLAIGDFNRSCELPEAAD